MDLSAVFSDDQIAVIGCFVALTACGLVAAISFQFGPAGKATEQNSASLKMDVVHQRNPDRSQKKAA
ncbi:MAG: hypothetical protein GY903_19675 [Fuerstiella sp.]|nr:hypothetical protein [Fuerstiella sp.]MCP4856707.1 hypothetical protein [Fuerstiella sp.]